MTKNNVIEKDLTRRTNRQGVLTLTILFLVTIILFATVISAYSRSAPAYTFGHQTTPYTGGQLLPTFNQNMCGAGQDFILQVDPLGCTPSPVRSDLLEEQEVSVLCPVYATQLNPLIKIENINYITISSRNLPKEVLTVGYYPARAALGKWGRGDEITRPVFDNIGYANIVLRRQSNESAMPDFVSGNLTANMRYDIHNAFGTGRSVYYIPQLTDEEFNRDYKAYGFWDGRGYLRLEDSDSEGATIEVYSDRDVTKAARQGEKTKIATLNLEKGETGKVFMPGFNYCLGGVNVKLTGLENPDTRTKIRVDSDLLEIKKDDTFLENACTIKNIRKQGINQYAEITCKEDKKRKTFTLRINPKVNISLDNEANPKVYSVGQKLYEDNNGLNSVYLGFVGNNETTGAYKGLYVRLISIPKDKGGNVSVLSERELSYIADYDRNVRSYGVTVGNSGKTSQFFKSAYAHISQLGRQLFTGKDPESLAYSDGDTEIFGTNVTINGYSGVYDLDMSALPKAVRDNYTRAMEDYETIKQSFASDVWPETDGETLGEKASYNAINLAINLEQRKTASLLCQEHLQGYNSSIPGICEDEYLLANNEVSSQSVVVNGKTHLISFEGAREPTFDEFGVEIFVVSGGETKQYRLARNEIIYLNDSTNELIQLVDLDEDKATFKTILQASGTTGVLRQAGGITHSLKLEEIDTFGSRYSFSIKKINLRKVAKVTLDPEVDYARTNATFNFKIGIEKRGIKLSPEKTAEKIKSLNETIEKLTEVSDKLGTVVTAGKTACLATTGALTLKNFFSNLGGKGIARQKVMRDSGGWYEKCQQMVNNKEYSSIDKCLLDNNDAIESSVNEVNNAINTQNAQMKRLEEGVSKTELLGEDIINTDALTLKLMQDSGFKTDINACTGSGTVNVAGKNVSKSEITKNISVDSTSLSQARDLQLYCKLISSEDSVLKALAGKNVDKILGEVYSNSQSGAQKLTFETESREDINNPQADAYAGENRIEGIYRGATAKAGNKYGIPEGVPVQLITYVNEKYVLELEGVSADGYRIKNVYNDTGAQLDRTKDPALGIRQLFSGFKAYDANTYENPYQNALARYYETDPYKGLPAVVPFDVKNGWYAAVKSNLPILGGIQAYGESGRVSSFYVCNVGSNGKEEFIGGDDICRGFVPQTGQSPKFPGLSDRESEKKMEDAVKAIEDATRQYPARSGYITINNQRIKVGEPAADVPDVECTDFMSASDCNLMFNVCDPFVCPSSRCDLGGTYPVKDVVQSGVIGSLALCAPNFPEVKIPICVSGVHAGVEGWNSVLKSYQQCLQTSLDTGQTVGICDEINSIYTCEFIWRQGLPLIKYGAPKAIAGVLGQNARGGGEYLTAQNAMDNVEKSIDYFTQYYADDSFKAFKARNSGQVGSELCRNYVSMVGPQGGNLLDTLTAPDSPTQFYGRFEEISYTTASNPPASQYKVFYHIYAGKDFPAYYQVYLRGTGSSFYQDTDFQRSVASGFIPAGEFKTETRDFTAPTGYKELCILVNGQEECGFKEVTTEFFLNSVTEQYVANEASKTNINSETECISGSPDSFNLLNPNMQAGVENTINPAIYNRGIIRVCSTQSPGQGTDAGAETESARWKKVGNCGSANLGCWLDTSSVKDVIKNTDTEEQALGEVTQSYLDALEKDGSYINKTEFESLEKELRESSDDSAIIGKINSKVNKVFYNNQKAYLFLLRGISYGNLAKAAYSVVRDKEKEEINAPSTVTIPEEILECNDCGRGIADICDEAECIDIGIQNQNECVFVDGTFTNTCTEKLIVEGVKTCSNQGECRTLIGNSLLEIASAKATQSFTTDDVVKKDTGANSFECLALQLASVETTIQHCSTLKDPAGTGVEGDPLYCNANSRDVIAGDNFTSFGIMQINIKAHPDSLPALYTLEGNVNYGTNFLIQGYNSAARTFSCTGKSYSGWSRALRNYNGWGCTGNNRYVEDVIAAKEKIASLFPQCA